MPSPRADVADVVRRTWPGLALAGGIAAVAFLATQWTPATVGPVLLAIVLGLVVGNLVTLPAGTAPGLAVAANRVLRIGVVLLGARLTLGDLGALGLRALVPILAGIAVVGVTIGVGARLLHLPPRLACLLGVGTAICGNSAIMATAPVIDAEERDVGFAVATITLLGTIGLFALPTLANLAELGAVAAGTWVGLAINDTSQVVAAGAVLGDEALDTATVVKLVRNALLAPVLLAITWVSARSSARRQPPETPHRTVRFATLRRGVPGFVLGFLALAALASTGVLADRAVDALGTLSTVAITTAIAAVGVRTRVAELVRVGPRPLLVAGVAAAALAATAFLWTGVTAGDGT